jgi:hypothetical protein
MTKLKENTRLEVFILHVLTKILYELLDLIF